jgi:hypothetical protein
MFNTALMVNFRRLGAQADYQLLCLRAAASKRAAPANNRLIIVKPAAQLQQEMMRSSAAHLLACREAERMFLGGTHCPAGQCLQLPGCLWICSAVGFKEPVQDMQHSLVGNLESTWGACFWFWSTVASGYVLSLTPNEFISWFAAAWIALNALYVQGLLRVKQVLTVVVAGRGPQHKAQDQKQSAGGAQLKFEAGFGGSPAADTATTGGSYAASPASAGMFLSGKWSWPDSGYGNRQNKHPCLAFLPSFLSASHYFISSSLDAQHAIGCLCATQAKQATSH